MKHFKLHYNTPVEEDVATHLYNAIADLPETGDEEIIGLALIHGHFQSISNNASFAFRQLLGAAAVLVGEAPIHKADCMCNTCVLRIALSSLVEQSQEYADKEVALQKAWLSYQPNSPSAIFHPVNHFKERDALKDEIPKIIERMAAEHLASVKEESGYL